MRGVEKAAKSAPWVAIVLALIGPFFGYLEVRAVRSHAAHEAGEAKGATGAAYRLLVREIERQAEDIDACHERVDRLAEALEEAPLMLFSPEDQQKSVSRPAPGEVLPKSSVDLPKGDLKEALEEAEESD